MCCLSTPTSHTKAMGPLSKWKPLFIWSVLIYDRHRVSHWTGPTNPGHLCHLLLLTDSVKASGGRVLVHCQAGISRSATICLAYLINARRVSLDEAFDFVKRRRQVISPNLAFMGQLVQFETDVNQTGRPFQLLCPEDWRLDALPASNVHESSRSWD